MSCMCLEVGGGDKGEAPRRGRQGLPGATGNEVKAYHKGAAS